MGNPAVFFILTLLFNSTVLIVGFDLSINRFSDPSASVLMNNHVKNLDDLIELQDLNSFDSSLHVLRERIRKQLSSYADQVRLVHNLGPGLHSPEELSPLSRGKRDTIRADKLTSAARRRRNYVVNAYDLSSLDEGVTHVVKRAYHLQKPSFYGLNVTDLNAITIGDATFIFAVETRSSRTFTVVYKFVKNWNLEEIGRLETPGALIVELIEVEGHHYILPAAYDPVNAYSLEKGSSLYRIDLSNNFKATKIQTINTEYARSITFWRSSGVDANDVILCVAPEKRLTSNGYRYKVDISCYRWQGGYFDLTYSIPAYNPKAVRLMSIASHSYMCVANYQDDSGSSTIYSIIYRYSHKKGNYVPFQRIQTYGAMDCQYFRFDSQEQIKEHYLAIANFGQVDEYGKVNYNVKSFIFKFGVGRFILHQSLVTFGAFQILPIQDGPKFLLIVGEMYRLSIYQHNGWNFVKTREIQLPGENLAHQFRMRPMLSDNQTYFTVASPTLPKESGIYGLEYEARNDYVTMSNDLEEWCVEAVKTIESTNLHQLSVDASKVPNTTEPEIIIKSSVVFASGLHANTIFTQSLEYKGVHFDTERSRRLAHQERFLEASESHTAALKFKLDNVVSLDGEQEIKSHVEFSRMVIANNTSTIQVAEFKVDNLNGIDLLDVLGKSVFLDQSYSLDLVDIPSLHATTEIQTEELNGNPIRDIALKSKMEAQMFLDDNIFTRDVSALTGFGSAGLINGVKPADILTGNSDQTFDEINVSYATVSNLLARIVNEVDMERLVHTSVSNTGQNEIHAPKSFGTAISSHSTEVFKLLSNISLDTIFNQAVFLSDISSSTFSDNPVFEHLQVRQLESGNGLINNQYNLSMDFVSIYNHSLFVDSINIYNNVGIQFLDIKNYLNDIFVHHNELDVVLKYSPNATQHLYGHNLDKLSLETSSTLDGTINGVDIKAWSQTKIIELEKPVVVGNVFAMDLHFSPPGLTAKAFEQGKRDVLGMLEKSMPLNSGQFPCRPIFESVQVDNNAQVNFINSISPTQDWVSSKGSTNSRQPITVGSKRHFFGDVTLLKSSAATAGLHIPQDDNDILNQLDVFSQFENVLLNGSHQGITGDFIVNDALKVLHLQADSRSGGNVYLDGVHFQDILFTIPGQSIQVPSSRVDKIVNIKSSLYVHEDIQANFVSGHQLESLVSNTLRTESREGIQTVRGNLLFSNGLYVNNDLHTQGQQRLGGYEIDQLLGNIILNQSNQTEILQGSLAFKKDARVSSLVFTNSVNEIPLNQWGYHWMTRQGNQEISTPLHFTDSLSVAQVFVQDNKVSGIDIVQLDREILRKTSGENESLSLGLARFQSDMFIEGSLCSPSVNGYDVSRDLLRKTSPHVQTITGTKTFEGDWKVEGHFRAPHLANSDFWSALRFSKESKTRENLVVHGDCISEREPFIILPESASDKPTVNDVDWFRLLDSVWFDNEDSVIETPIQFDSVHFNAGGSLFGPLDGVDLTAFDRDYLSLHRDQNWTANFQFDSHVWFERGLETHSTEIYNGTLNGLNIQDFSRSVLLDELGSEQTVTSKLVLRNLIAPNMTLTQGGSINGIDFCTNVLTVDGRGIRSVEGLKHIQSLLVENKLRLEQDVRINGVSLELWRDMTVSTTGNFALDGERTFEIADFKDLQVNGLVDGKIVSRDTVMTLQGRQSGSGDLIIENNNNNYVTSFSRLYTGGNFNGEKIEQYFDNFVLVNETDDKPLYVYGHKTIQGNMHTNWLRSEGPYEQHGINVVEFLKNYSADAYVSQNFNVALEDRYEKIGNWTTELIHVATERAVMTKCFGMNRKIALTGVAWIKVLHGLKQPMIALVVRDENKEEVASWFTYNMQTRTYEMYRSAQGRMKGVVVDQAEIERKGQYYVFASVSSVNNVEVTSSFPEYPSPVNFHLNDETHKLSQGVVLVLRGDLSGNRDLTVFQVVYGDKFGKVLSFHIVTGSGSRRDCILYSILDEGNFHADVYCFNSLDFPGQDDDAVHLFQKIPLSESPQVTSMVIESKTLVIISGGDDVNRTKLSHGVVNVWTHNPGDGPLVKEDTFPTVNVISMDSLLAPNNNPFLAVVSGRLDDTNHAGLVYIYKYSLSKNRFIKYQTIHEDNPIMVRFQRVVPSDELFLYILTGNTDFNVNVYSFKGVSGWVKEFSFTSSGAELIEPSAFYYQGEYRAHVLISSSTEVSVIDIDFNGVPYISQENLLH